MTVKHVEGVTPSTVLLLGGGGMLGQPWSHRLKEYIDAKPRVSVLWGVGSNTHSSAKVTFPKWLDRVDLAGVRDYGTAYRWVPCPSCLSPLFDRGYAVEHEAVVYRHAIRELDTIPKLNLPTMTNGNPSLEQVLRFMGSAETVITSSYHGAYWASLLGRKVIAVPFSSKFYGMKHAPVLVNAERAAEWARIVVDAKAYPHALQECRQANDEFYEDVVKATG